MGAAELAALLLSAAGEVAQLAAQSIDAARAGDDLKALELLDQAIVKLKDRIASADVALDAVRQRVLKRIDDKFGGGEGGASGGGGGIVTIGTDGAGAP